MRAAGPARPRLRPLGLRAVGAARPAARHGRYLHDEARIFLPAVLRELGVERSILVGHSDGGTHRPPVCGGASRAATAAIVTEAAHVFVEEITLAGIRAAGVAYATTDLPRPPRPLSRRQDRWHLQGLARRLALARVPRLEHRGRAAAHHLPRPGPARGGRRVRHAGAGGRRSPRGVSGPVESVLLPGCGHTPHQQAADRCSI